MGIILKKYLKDLQDLVYRYTYEVPQITLESIYLGSDPLLNTSIVSVMSM